MQTLVSRSFRGTEPTPQQRDLIKATCAVLMEMDAVIERKPEDVVSVILETTKPHPHLITVFFDGLPAAVKKKIRAKVMEMGPSHSRPTAKLAHKVA